MKPYSIVAVVGMTTIEAFGTDFGSQHQDLCFGRGLFVFKGCVMVIWVGVSKVQLFEELGRSSALQGQVLRRVRCLKLPIAPLHGFLYRYRRDCCVVTKILSAANRGNVGRILEKFFFFALFCRQLLGRVFVGKSNLVKPL